MSHLTPLESFREACGLDRPICLTCQEADSPDVVPVPLDDSRTFLMIGRHPMAGLSLNHPQVSRRHAYLQAVAGRVVCIDLKSRTKTLWDGQEVAQPWGWVAPGQSVRIGPYRIQRTDRSPEDTPPNDPLDPFSPAEGDGSRSDALPRADLVLPFRVGGIAASWEMRGLLALVGRTDDCQFVLTDNSVSQYHACLVRTPLGVWVVDLAAREGVYVNGTRVRWAWLGDGDLVRFGLFTMVLRYEQPPTRLAREDVPLEAGASPNGSIADDSKVIAGPPSRDRTGLAVRPKAGPSDLQRTRVPRHAVPAAAPAAVNRGEWEPELASGPSPFAMWQQQMQLMETFHNDMAMMVQMFVAMHREFQASVGGQLDRVQQLTRELNRLNKRLGQLPAPAEDGPAAGTGRPDREARSGSQEHPARPEAKHSTRRARRAVEASERKPEERAGGPGLNGSSARATSDEGTSQTSAPKVSSADMYAEVTRRITHLQRERRGYWERILKTISG